MEDENYLDSIKEYLKDLKTSSQKYKILRILNEALIKLNTLKHDKLSESEENIQCSIVLRTIYESLTSEDLIIVKPDQVKRKPPVSKISKPKKKVKRKGKPGINPNAWNDESKLLLAKEVKKLGGKIPGWTKIIVDKDLFPHRSNSSINSMYNQMLRESHPYVKDQL